MTLLAPIMVLIISLIVSGPSAVTFHYKLGELLGLGTLTSQQAKCPPLRNTHLLHSFKLNVAERHLQLSSSEMRHAESSTKPCPGAGFRQRR